MTASQVKPTPAAPPVYRPQPTPKVLQTKMASNQPPQSIQPPRAPVAPPVYRPEPKKIVQPKMAPEAKAFTPPNAPPVYRPESKKLVQPKMAAAQSSNQPKQPPVYRPQPTPRVLRKKDSPTVATAPAQHEPTPPRAQQHPKHELQPSKHPAGSVMDARHERATGAGAVRKNQPPARLEAIQPKTATTPNPYRPTSIRQDTAHPFSIPGGAKRARLGGNVVQRAAPAVANVASDDDESGGLEEGKEREGTTIPEMMKSSTAIYRVMPESEADKTLRDGVPDAKGHFWSPVLKYVIDYMNGPGKNSTSNTVVTFPLKATYHAFLDAAAAKNKLHAHNFGNSWDESFPGRNKQKKKDKGVVSIKNDNGTPTITFLSIPDYLQEMLGKPSVVPVEVLIQAGLKK
jgi:hypothetical protein